MATLNIKIDTFLDPIVPPRPGHSQTSYSRAVNKLTERGQNPGKLIPIGLEIDGNYKILGTFSINSGGSISFFQDIFMMDDYFDHITFNKDFQLKKGHLTIIKTNGKHKKTQTIEAYEQEEDEFLLATFAMQNGDGLMDHDREINVTVDNYDETKEAEFLNLFKEAMADTPRMMSFPDEPGFYCIQFTLVAKGKDINDVKFNTGALKSLIVSKKLLTGIFNAQKTLIETNNGLNFDVCIMAVKINEELKSLLSFSFALSPIGHPQIPQQF